MARPKKFQNVKELQKKINEYFDECKETNEVITYSGLAHSLGTTRKTLWEYTQRGDEMSEPIEDALARIERYYETILVGRTGGQVAGLIFCMKNNFNWADKQTIDLHDVTTLTDEELNARIKTGLDQLRATGIDPEMIGKGLATGAQMIEAPAMDEK